jgi:hypothetical protein
MNKENAHLYLPLVQALADGKAIQWLLDDGTWDYIDELEFGMYDDPSCYRIRSELRRFEVWVHKTGGDIICKIPPSWGDASDEWERITVQEVLE